MVNGLNFALQYQGANDGNISGEGSTNSNRSIRAQNGDGLGMSTSYDFGMGVSASGAYASSDRTNDQVNGTIAEGDKAEVWTVGLKYDANKVYLATMYSETRNMTGYR